MAAPTPAATPHAPAGMPIEDGHPTIITIDADPDISFWEVTVTPPGVDGGDANDLSNMHNVEWRTYAPRVLKTLTEAGATVHYAPEAFTQIVAIVNEETTITVHKPGGAKLAFYGYVRVWTPGDNQDGSPPTATIAIQPTNRDPDDGTEAGPVLVLPVGGVRGRRGRVKRRKDIEERVKEMTRIEEPAKEKVADSESAKKKAS